PATPWTVYQLDATDDGTNGTPSHPGCPCFGDQPRLGIDSQNIYISTDEFSINGPEFNGTQIYAVSKANLIHHAKTVHFVQFDNLSIGGDIAFGVQPALTRGLPMLNISSIRSTPTATATIASASGRSLTGRR